MAKSQTALKSTRSAPAASAVHRYPSSFLTMVIARVDFASPINLPDTGPPSSILKHTRSEFPIYEEEAEVDATFAVTGSGATASTGQPRKVFKLWAKDRQKSATLARDHFSVEYKKYHSFNILTSDFNALLTPLGARFKQLQCKRLGLRYVNTIEPKDNDQLYDWSNYLVEELIASFSLGDPGNLTRSFHIIERDHGEFRSKLQYGMINPDYPAKIKKKSFIIDTDHVNSDLLTVGEVQQALPVLHDAAKAVFESLIKDDLRDFMNKP